MRHWPDDRVAIWPFLKLFAIKKDLVIFMPKKRFGPFCAKKKDLVTFGSF